MQTGPGTAAAPVVLPTAYRPDIDGLRALAVCAVIAFHYDLGGRWSRAGFLGVDIFFVISGFLITQVLLRSSQTPDYLKNFYFRRARRILPALVTLLITITILGMLLLVPSELSSLGKHTFGGSFSVANVLYWNEAGYFDPSSVLKPLLHLWSLGIEEQFYLLWPLFILLIVRRRVSPFLPIFFVTVISFLYAISMSIANPTLAYYSPFTRGWELAAGGLVAVIPWVGSQSVHRIGSFAGAALLSGSLLMFSGSDAWPSWGTLLPVVGSALLLWGGQTDSAPTRFLGTRPLVWIGLISFSLYLWHWPLWSFYNIILGQEPTRCLNLSYSSSHFSFPLAVSSS
ncbi:MAG: acyltransferase [Verrucomicrobiaceae bacterium]